MAKISVYPEPREASHPTTLKIINRFDNNCTHKITVNSKLTEGYEDRLNEDQKLILSLLNTEHDEYWLKFGFALKKNRKRCHS